MGFKQRLKAFLTLDYKYAFLEIILIVIGILIAFGVDTWWQNKQDLKKEKAYLGALKTELQENKTRYEIHLRNLDQDIATTHHFLSLLKTNTTIPVDSLKEYLWPLITIEIISPNRAALDDLINSGGMQYIRSDILRRGIAAYEQSFVYDFEKQRASADLWNTTLSVFNLENTNLTQLMPQNSIKGARKEALVKLPSMNFETTFSAKTRQIYANRLVQRVLLINRLRQTHNAVLKNIRTLLFQLDAGSKPKEKGKIKSMKG